MQAHLIPIHVIPIRNRAGAQGQAQQLASASETQHNQQCVSSPTNKTLSLNKRVHWPRWTTFTNKNISHYNYSKSHSGPGEEKKTSHDERVNKHTRSHQLSDGGLSEGKGMQRKTKTTALFASVVIKHKLTHTHRTPKGLPRPDIVGRNYTQMVVSFVHTFTPLPISRKGYHRTCAH